MTGDPSDYVILATPAGRFALTPTCAANAVGIVPDTAFAKADRETARRGFAKLGAAMGMDGDALATAVLDLACAKVVTQVRALVDEYRLQPSSVDLIGGGGGAASLVPRTGELMGVPWRLARQAEVISPIGVALAMVRDTIEETSWTPRRPTCSACGRRPSRRPYATARWPRPWKCTWRWTRAATWCGPWLSGPRNCVAVARPIARRTRMGADPRQRARCSGAPADVTLVATTGQLDVFTSAARAGGWWQPWRREAGQLRVVDRPVSCDSSAGTRWCEVYRRRSRGRTARTRHLPRGLRRRWTHDSRRLRARRVEARQPVRPGRRGPDARPRRRRGPRARP